LTNTDSGAFVAVEQSQEIQSSDGVSVVSTTHPIKEPDPEPTTTEEAIASVPDDENLDGDVDEELSDPQEEHRPKKKGGFQRRLERLERHNQELAAELSKYKSPAPENTAVLNDDAPPRESDFEDVLDFIDARDEWKYNQRKKQEELQKTEQGKVAYEQELEIKYVESINELAKQDPEIWEKIADLNEAGVVSKNLQDAVYGSDLKAEITKHLVTYPQDAKILSSLPREQLFKSIGALEILLSESKRSQQKTVVRQTQAAAPINPVRGNASGNLKDPAEMSQSEYEAWRYSNRR
jgi:hypothetical protein